uniref:DUF4283 domain-containing protein n=1 Tax=Oryza brachyantha TaxID=4533 RepID=J3L0N7_ORYBR
MQRKTAGANQTLVGKSSAHHHRCFHRRRMHNPTSNHPVLRTQDQECSSKTRTDMLHQLGVRDFPPEHWFPVDIVVAFSGIGEVVEIDERCTMGQDHSSLRLVLMTHLSTTIPEDLWIHKPNDHPGVVARIRVVRSWSRSEGEDQDGLYMNRFLSYHGPPQPPIRFLQPNRNPTNRSQHQQNQDRTSLISNKTAWFPSVSLATTLVWPTVLKALPWHDNAEIPNPSSPTGSHFDPAMPSSKPVFSENSLLSENGSNLKDSIQINEMTGEDDDSNLPDQDVSLEQTLLHLQHELVTRKEKARAKRK